MQQKIGVGVAVFIWRDGKFLLMQRTGSHGHETWSIPGGHLEFGESWVEAGTREVLEETGMEIKNVSFLATTNDLFPDHNKHYVTIWLTADWAANEPAILEPQKCKDIKWITLKELPKNLFQPCWENLHDVVPEFFG
ncbi:MAG TPA: NUDIX domain-containing protein [Candidatus Limnocylindria bacterium]|nr:NUDIX domain-containing protein [Candidatus Limnocylindria bacterium]